jgi:Flp pilus assembly protein TadG
MSHRDLVLKKKRFVIRRFIGEECGNTMVEFALVAAFVFIPLVFGIIEFGRVIWTRNVVTAAAREGVRYAIVHSINSGSEFDSAAVAGYVEGRTAITPIAVSTAWTGTKKPGDEVSVTVSYLYTPVVKVPGLLTSKTVTGQSKQIIQY